MIPVQWDAIAAGNDSRNLFRDQFQIRGIGIGAQPAHILEAHIGDGENCWTNLAALQESIVCFPDLQIGKYIFRPVEPAVIQNEGRFREEWRLRRKNEKVTRLLHPLGPEPDAVNDEEAGLGYACYFNLTGRQGNSLKCLRF